MRQIYRLITMAMFIVTGRLSSSDGNTWNNNLKDQLALLKCSVMVEQHIAIREITLLALK